MARIQQARYSFQSGVISPRMALRADLQSFREALEIGRNVIITPQGGLIMRQGFQRVTPAQQSNTENRTFRFNRGGDKSDLLVVVGDGAIILLDEDPVTRELITVAQFDNYFGGPAPELSFTNTERLGVLVQPAHPPYYIEVSEQNEYTGEHLPPGRVPQVLYFDNKSPQNAAERATYRVTIPEVTADGGWFTGMRYVCIYGGDVANEGFELPREYWPIWQGNLPAQTVRNEAALAEAIKNTVWLLSDTAEVEVTASNPPYTFDIEIIGPGAGKELVVQPAPNMSDAIAADVQVISGQRTEGTEPAWSYPNVVEHNGAFYQCLKVNYSEVGVNEPVPGGNEWWDELPGKPSWFDWQYGDPRSPGVGENFWAEDIAYGPWGRGWPQVAVIFQQRVILFTLDEHPTSLWGSRIGNYRDFQQGVNASDPFYFDLDTSGSPKIKWADPTQSALILGTGAGDFRLGSEISLGPADIQLTKQNSARSHRTEAASVSNTAFYIEQGRTKVRATSYGRNRNAWTSTDVTLAAEHLFQQRVKRIILLQHPEELFVILRDDGNAVFMHRFDQGEGMVLAFSELITADEHFIEDIVAYYSTAIEEDCIVASVIDPVNNERSFQRLEYPKRDFTALANGGSESLAEQGVVYLDGWIRPANPGTGVFDVTPLRGTVAVVMDDAWVGEFPVDSGQIVLPPVIDTAGKDVIVGYPFHAVVRPFEEAEGNQRGTGFGTKRRWNKLYVRMLDSALPKINGKLAADRRPPVLMGTADTIRAGVHDVKNVADGYSDGVFEIVQDRPYPMHILGVFGELEVSNA